MKRAALILLLTAAPATANDGPFGNRDCEDRGPVRNWPDVRQARARERLCPDQQMALYMQDKRALEAATPALYRPSYTPAYRPAAPATPAPPPPSISAASQPFTPPSQPAAPR